MKGIVLAGGSGSRLYPSTLGVSKQLLSVYDKPMIYYPISVLMMSEIWDICIITTPDDQAAFQRLLGDGSRFGVRFTYKIQPQPKGLAQAFTIAEDFMAKDDVCLVLGDNIFYGAHLPNLLLKAKASVRQQQKAVIFGYKVKDPERYGVVELGVQNQPLSIEEKPMNPKSDYAVTGLYYYPNEVIEIAKTVQPSARGELEITDVNRAFLAKGLLDIHLFGRGHTWLDTGTHDALSEATDFIKTIAHRTGLRIACLEEIALENKWIDKSQLAAQLAKFKNSAYGDYLAGLIKT